MHPADALAAISGFDRFQQGRMRPVDKLAPIRSFDRFQQAHRVLAVSVAVQKKVSDDSAGNYAALIAYYGFLSMFPLLLLAVAILGFIVHSNASAEHTILNSGLPNIPIIGTTLKHGHLSGSGLAVAVGAVGALWSGLAITNTLENTFNQINAVPRADRPGFLAGRLRGVGLLFGAGILELVAITLTGLVSAGVGGLALDIGGFALSLVLNGALFAFVFRMLSADTVTNRELWPGVVFATIGWELIQALGGIYVHHVLNKASATYGTFASVIGLLAWLYLGARVVVYAAELNSVLAQGRWPRSLLAAAEPAPPGEQQG
jgi:membrane protein